MIARACPNALLDLDEANEIPLHGDAAPVRHYVWSARCPRQRRRRAHRIARPNACSRLRPTRRNAQ